MLSKQTKQGGQQLLMLEAFQMANTFTRGQYTGMVTAWKPLVLQRGDNAGEPEDWVTTQAMGIALQALQALPVSASDDSSTPTALPTVGV